MAKRDYYETLGVQRNASAGQIKAAFRKLAMQHHPDRNSGDKAAEQRFKELNEAHEVLSNPDRRAAYDRFGHAEGDRALLPRADLATDTLTSAGPGNQPSGMRPANQPCTSSCNVAAFVVMQWKLPHYKC